MDRGGGAAPPVPSGGGLCELESPCALGEELLGKKVTQLEGGANVTSRFCFGNVEGRTVFPSVRSVHRRRAWPVWRVGSA